MSPFDPPVLAERAAAVDRHLARVRDRLPATADEFTAATDASDAVILHLWQATQIVTIWPCRRAWPWAGTPQTYADAFRRLQRIGAIEPGLADRLVKAAGFRNVVAHAYEQYEQLDLGRVHQAASQGPPDLRAFIAAVRPFAKAR